MTDRSTSWPNDYFKVRDFELVQPLYNLSFLLQIIPLAAKKIASKYRTFSLHNAAQSLDSYSNGITRWLSGELREEEMDYPPSLRLKRHLTTIMETGSLPELDEVLSNRGRGCLRLGSVRGLGPKIIAEFYSKNSSIPKTLITKAAKRSGLNEEKILSIFHGQEFGIWQTAHVIPPLIRLLRSIERGNDKQLFWKVEGIKNAFDPINKPFRIILAIDQVNYNKGSITKLINKSLFFSSKKIRSDSWRVQHEMGWHFELCFGPVNDSFKPLKNIAATLDPLLHDVPDDIYSDLHMHTSWSDGLATLSNMALSAAHNGLKYIAITDHSRSSRLQGGLRPAEWIRQAITIKGSDLACPILHGLEVDILSDGHLDMPKGLTNAMGIVIGSFHSGLTNTEQSNTKRLIEAIESGQVDIIGHPTTALVGRPGDPNYVRPPIKADWDAIFEKCAKWQVALEVNCFPSRLDLGGELLQKAVEAGCWLSLGTDAHARLHLNLLKYGISLAAEMKAQKLLNKLDYQEIKSWLSQAREARKNRTLGSQPFFPGTMFEPSDDGNCTLSSSISSKQRIPDGSVVVGFDLTASKNKKTGVAKLEGMYVETTSLGSDEELLAYVREIYPAIVSIDSPLGLPGGGEKIDKGAGIVRVAEHDLSSIGIPAYPALIDSMKPLTLRGIKLRKAIQAFPDAPKVIESYPGAAQDILSIPRKQRGLDLLRAGLKDLGLFGPGLETLSHDEMDAITSALVGRYYESGEFEAMGIPSEAQLIVPRVQLLEFEYPPIIAIAGKTGAGKSVVSRYLAINYGFKWIKTRDLIGKLYIEDFESIRSTRFGEDVHPSEDDLLKFGTIILRERGQGPLRTALHEEIKKSNEGAVIDAIRSIEDIDYSMFEHPIPTWYVDCPDKLIEERLSKRGYKKVSSGRDYKPIDQNAGKLKEKSSFIIDNSKSLQQLHYDIDDHFFTKMVKVKHEKEETSKSGIY